MLDPFGDARQRGRLLNNGYERGETLKFAEALKRVLLKRCDSDVIIARTPGEEKLPLQIATFANRLEVQFVLSLCLYRSNHSKPKAYLYQLTYNTLVDTAPRVYRHMTFTPFEEAHFRHLHTTKTIGVAVQTFFAERYSKLVDVFGPFGIPVKPLAGIMSPALLLEVGVYDDNQWETLVEPLCEAIVFSLQK